jgi:hypothetical protein
MSQPAENKIIEVVENLVNCTTLSNARDFVGRPIKLVRGMYTGYTGTISHTFLADVSNDERLGRGVYHTVKLDDFPIVLFGITWLDYLRVGKW